MNIGDKIPEILGKDENGNEVKASDFAGKKLVLYFYPKDMTPGCTSEACSLRDGYDELRAKGYEVIGVSVDSPKRHLSFIEKNSLPFHLVADENHDLVQAFGVWGEKKMAGRTYEGIYRTTFLVNEEGKVEKIFTPKEVKVKEHAQQILNL